MPTWMLFNSRSSNTKSEDAVKGLSWDEQEKSADDGVLLVKLSTTSAKLKQLLLQCL